MRQKLPEHFIVSTTLTQYHCHLRTNRWFPMMPNTFHNVTLPRSLRINQVYDTAQAQVPTTIVYSTQGVNQILLICKLNIFNTISFVANHVPPCGPSSSLIVLCICQPWISGMMQFVKPHHPLSASLPQWQDFTKKMLPWQ